MRETFSHLVFIFSPCQIESLTADLQKLTEEKQRMETELETEKKEVPLELILVLITNSYSGLKSNI